MGHYSTIKLVLTGKLTGRNVTLNRVRFTNGLGEAQVNPEAVQAFLTYMARSHRVYQAGSPALLATQERDKADGLLNHLQTATASADGASAGLQGAPAGSTGALPEACEVLGSGNDADQAGGPGMVPLRSGHTDAGLGDRVESSENLQSEQLIARIRAAVEKLDPKVDDHWSAEGLPSVEYIADAIADQTVDRKAIDVACTGWNRLKAIDLAGL